jgi:Isoleucyl-tRNA synthetase
VKDQMVALNKQITWKPESTGTGRFGQWLENIQDWNLSQPLLGHPAPDLAHGGRQGREMHRHGR